MKMVATMYECHKCHRKVSAATARKDHYKDPMGGVKMQTCAVLVPGPQTRD